MCNAMQYLGKQCLEKNHPSQFEFDGVVRNKSSKISKKNFVPFQLPVEEELSKMHRPQF